MRFLYKIKNFDVIKKIIWTQCRGLAMPKIVCKYDILSSEKTLRRKEDKIAHTRAFIRHDSEKLAKVLVMLLEIEGYESILKDIV